jgi:hypothetical protein
MAVRVNADGNGWRVRCGPWRRGVKWAGQNWIDGKLDIKGQLDDKRSAMRMPVEVRLIGQRRRETGLGLAGMEGIRAKMGIIVRVGWGELVLGIRVWIVVKAKIG